MTVASEQSRVILNGNGATTAFPFTFRIFATTDVEVVKTDADGNESTLSEGSGSINYSVTINGEAGGTVTYPAAGGTALASGEKLTITRRIPMLQSFDFTNQGSFLSENHEDAFDKLTMMVLELKEASDRSLKIPVSDESGTSTTLDSADIVTLASNISDIETVASQAAAGVKRNSYTGDGSTVTFALPSAPWTADVVFAYLDGVNQDNANWSVSGSNITFDTAPGSGVNIELVVLTVGTSAGATASAAAAAASATAAAVSETNAAASAASAAAATNEIGLIDTLAELQALTGGVNEAVQMKGRATAGDGGGGFFRWVSGDQSVNVSDDEVTASQGDGGVWVSPATDRTGASGAWQRVYNGLVNASWYGAAATNTDSENKDIIESVLALFDVVEVDEGVTYDQDTISIPSGKVVYDFEKAEIIYGQTALRSGSQTRHITIRAIDNPGIAGLYIMPNGLPAASGSSRQVGALKVFFEDYDALFGGATASDYRDAGFTCNNKDSHNGMGSIQINSQSGGNFIPFAPDIHFGFRNNAYKPLRILYPQFRALPAGTYFTGGIADFEESKAIWRAGETYSQGKLINAGPGRIYEAQSTGTAGSSRPVHATYELYVITVSDTTGFQVGESVDTGAGASFPRGTIYDIPDGTTLRLNALNAEALENGFTVSSTLEGATSGTTQTISAVSTANLDYDFDPDGGASQQFNAVAVAGRTVSDGGISWKFLDDLTGGNSNNETAWPIVVFGDEDSAPTYYDTTLRFQFHDYRVGIHETSGIDFVPTSDTTKRYKLDVSLGLMTLTDPDGATIEFVDATKNIHRNGFSDSYELVQKADLATTMDVNGVGVAQFSDTAPTNFTEFTGGAPGQVLIVRFNSGQTTLIHANNQIELPGGANLTPAARTAYQFVRTGNKWTMVQ